MTGYEEELAEVYDLLYTAGAGRLRRRGDRRALTAAGFTEVEEVAGWAEDRPRFMATLGG